MALSKRHHYIPQFLIKNFADDNNMLWVYNKEKKRMLDHQQSPKAIFFEMGRNLFELNGELVDNIEKMYADVDDMLAKTTKKILATHAMTGPELTCMILLVGLMKWRVPKADTSFKDLTKDVSIQDLGLALRPIDPSIKADKETANSIENMDITKEVKRLLLAIQPLTNEETLNEIHRNCFIVSDTTLPGLLGDCPIIESPNAGFDTLQDFIFPLGKHETLICKRDVQKGISHPLFYLQKDLTIFHLSEKFVACKDRNHLENISKTYEKVVKENQAHLLPKYIFEFVV